MDRWVEEEQKRLYKEYKEKLAKLKKIEGEKNAVGQVFTKGLLPIYVLYILSTEPTNGNDISRKIGEKTDGLWIPSTGGIYPILKRFEKEGLITGSWNEGNKKVQKIYSLTNEGKAEFQNKRELLRNNIEQSLQVFEKVYKDLYF